MLHWTSTYARRRSDVREPWRLASAPMDTRARSVLDADLAGTRTEFSAESADVRLGRLS